MMQAAVMTHLKCSISCTIGTEEDSLEDSIASYTRSAEASLHRLFMGPGCLIYTVTSWLITPRNTHSRQVRKDNLSII